jgi:MoxR-like ATPase
LVSWRVRLIPRKEIGPLQEHSAANPLERALFEIKRVIAGQDVMLERVLVCLLADGHLLIEGVPGLAKTLTIKTTAQVLGGTFNRVQFTPDLMPSDLVGTRVYRPKQGDFDVELGPVFCNFLLADEINRAPAKVQSALLEVMQERQVTIGKESFAAPDPFLVMATQNPIESEGTYPLPEAQVDRFMLKVLVGYPQPEDEVTIVERSLAGLAEVRSILDLEELGSLREATRQVYVDPALSRYAVQIAAATRDPASVGLAELAPFVAFGASPRGPIALVTSARALALIHGRDYVLPQDLRALAKDALHHRIVLSYEALAADIGGGTIVDSVLDAVPAPEIDVVELVA